MKIRNIAKKNGKEINLKVKGTGLIIFPNQEVEINDTQAKELLEKKIDNLPIVEKVKENKTKDKED